MNTNFQETIKMEASDEWQEHFGNGDLNYGVNDLGQMFPETLDGDGEDDAEGPEIIYVYMNIQQPIEILKNLLQDKTKKNLANYEVWLQNVQMLEPFKTLVDQCVKGEGLVQVNAQIIDSLKRINIADVVKPAEEADDAMKSIGLDGDIVMHENDPGNSNDSSDCTFFAFQCSELIWTCF